MGTSTEVLSPAVYEKERCQIIKPSARQILSTDNFTEEIASVPLGSAVNTKVDSVTAASRTIMNEDNIAEPLLTRAQIVCILCYRSG